MMASMVASGNDDAPSLNLKGVDPETCMIVFKNHWAQVAKILEKHDPLRTGGGGLLGGGLLGGGTAGAGLRFGPIPGDEASAVQNYVEHMLFLLMEEDSGQEGAMGPILEFVVTENVMEQLFLWSLRREFTDDMKVEQLKVYEMLVGQSRQPLLHHKPILRPLMMLLGSCAGAGAPAVEAELVLLLNQLCSILAKDPSVLELFFHTSEDQGAANFLIFSLLIPFIHREGRVGQQARDALLLIMSLSAENRTVAEHIAQNTYFCPVLATGLSGLYSSLPTRLEVQSEDWHCLQREEWQQVPTLVQFLNSLEFCNAVIQVAHPTIRDQLVGYIYNGFLVPVLAPALHKLTLEEVMTTTAYLDLFLRNVTEPALLQTFLSFILMHQYEKVHILDTLVSRINTPFQLGTVSLALFHTLIGLHCEDVMLQLILRYLIPCNHMMLSQRWVVRERDCYSVSAAKLLSLTPSCCSMEPRPPPLRQQLDYIVWSKGTDRSHPGNKEMDGSLSEGGGAEHSRVMGSEVVMDISYVHYLCDARRRITCCIRACRVWSAPYDGEDPPPEEYHPSVPGEDPGKSRPVRPQPRGPQQPRQSVDLGPAGERPNQLELEWDNSYDTALSPDKSDGAEGGDGQPPVPAEPPPHIQEMRRNATLLIKGSYIEESDFQDDVMVYDLVAQKDAKSAANDPQAKEGRTEAEATSPGPDSAPAVQEVPQEEPQPPISNGLSPAPQPIAAEGLGGAEGSSDGAKPDQGTQDDLVAQYEELIRTLGADSGSPVKAGAEFRSPITPVDEDEVDFSSFTADTPETEKVPSPLGPKGPGGTRVHEVPFTGPFISVLLSRLENMLQNSLHINLLLTDILAQMASYPQPLLRSFLLNTNMVFQPSVRSLYQVLASVKNQIERNVSARKDFPELLTEAQHCLLSRETVQMARDPLLDSHGVENGDWPSNAEVVRNQLIPERLPKNPAANPKLAPEDRNMVLATVLFSEFLKELAAISQEHSILSHTPMEE
ncbi:protein FAM160A1 [Anguilla anguilla]|uniref:protein FAM160A1 n=1 Tax=Anguilla anguilla TaxID=7936 RepID=UPI0015A7ABF1|nr:protein FAM160A1 [Anguilla anguilla]XP_035274738.1 protein FAM160A1 [Anguilla anguilla]XP_035274739.1 protein FAM160A1 [Anguilla anguilla]XP_035274740.1 protein FAM160A1 [Anguilla anguilla]